MGRFADAIVKLSSQEMLERKHNYLCNLLDEGYSVEGLIGSNIIKININANDGIKFTNDGDAIFYIDPATGQVVIGKYDDAISTLNTNLGTAYNDIAQKLGYADYDAMVAAATAGQTIITGGYLRTSLIQANTILFDQLASATVTSINDEIDLGGRNLLRGSSLASFVTWAGSSTTLSSTASYPTYLTKCERANDANPFGAQQGTPYRFMRLEANVEYTLSFDVRGTVGLNLNYVYVLDAGTNNHKIGTTVATVASETAWQKVTARFTRTTSSDVGHVLIASSDTGAGKWFEFRKVKIEIGNKASDWSPSPEDSRYTGSTVITGGNVTTGKVQSVDGSAYFDLDTPEIIQNAVIDGKDVRVEVSPANPFKLSIEGVTNMQNHIYVTGASGFSGSNKLITSKYDINEDGIVDWQDLKLVRDYIFSVAGSYPPESRMDVNDDGTVDANDLLLIYQNIPNADRVSTSLGLQAGIASGGLWVSSNWGTTKYYQPDASCVTSDSAGAGGSTKWVKIATVNFGSRYTYAAVKLLVMGSPSTAGVGYGASLYFTAIQQNAFASNPLGRLYISDCVNIGTGDVAAIITATEADYSEVEIWVKAVHDYKVLSYSLINKVGSASITLHKTIAWAASATAGTAMTVTQVD